MRVHFVNDEARSFVARSTERYRTIQISLIDTWAATAAGAFVLGENALYTVEAWTVFPPPSFRRRAADGLAVVFSRSAGGDIPDDVDRGRGPEGDRSGGTAAAHHDCSKHEPGARVAARHARRRGNDSRQPSALHREELDTLAGETQGLHFDVPFSPRVARDETFMRLTDPTGRHAFLDSYLVNISPSTDDSPFFFDMLRLRDIGRRSLLDFGNLSHNMKAVTTLGRLFVTVRPSRSASSSRSG